MRVAHTLMFLTLACCNCPAPPLDMGGDALPDAGLPDAGLKDSSDSRPVDAGLDGARDADVAQDASSDQSNDVPGLGPPYPIVLAHGFFGFDEFAGLDFETYFFEVKADLLANGEALVFTPTVDPFNDSVRRGEQLRQRIEAILSETGHQKVVIIGHSQGGLDARAVAHHAPDRVAAILTISTPHEGTPVADIVVGATEDERLARLVDSLARIVAAPLFDEVGNETSVVASFRQLSTSGAAQFNAAHPDGAVPIYSLAGRSDRHFGGNDCRVSDRPSFISEWDLIVDPIDPLFALTEEILDGGLLAPYPNDGLVRVRDAKRGRFLGCIPADHMDQVGQILGDRPGLLNTFRHKPFYRELVGFLRSEGF